MRESRRAASLDDVLIKIIAGVVVTALAVGGFRWYQGAQEAGELHVIVAQAQRQVAASVEAVRRTEQTRLVQAQAEQVRMAEVAAQSTMYKCRDASGTIAIQNWPCNAGAQAEWSRSYQPRDEREAAEANQRAADIARHEAEVAQYTRMFGDRPAPVTYSAGPQPNDKEARCAAAKSYRDDVYRQVGNRRTFDLIRQLNDMVYEACKAT